MSNSNPIVLSLFMLWLYQADEVSWVFFICDYSKLAIHKGQLHKYLSVAKALVHTSLQFLIKVFQHFIMKSWGEGRTPPHLCLPLNYRLFVFSKKEMVHNSDSAF